MIYFIQGVNGGPVKIGKTDDIDTRLRSLQRGSPVALEVIRQIDGGYVEEFWLHRHFAAQRLHGESFEFDDRMLSVVPPASPRPEPTPLSSALAKRIGFRKPHSVCAVAEAIGVSKNSVQNWINAKCEPTSGAMVDLWAFLDPQFLTETTGLIAVEHPRMGAGR
jgi:hypothetical protein